ncbi:hypothetical protein QQ020_11470 [Fulvivirgaceae bacterium BMA12]|uniref:Uncharacterized protein n=1 Tax=Agaribacillus aureus TaxID=3051825 RepID=A0ABT8L6L7_9BACT|nr:hypothetical protein [Fulvivirgaceae bacterium BMA12]
MNTHNTTPPYLRLTLFTLVVSLAIYVVHWLHPQSIYHNIEFLLAFFYATFLFTYFLISLAFKNKDAKSAVIINLSAVVIRLIACVISAYFFLRNDPENHNVFVTNFLVVYLFYLGFEIYSILSNLRPNLKP